EGLDRDVAVFSEPAACAMHGLERLEIRPGSSALVIGAGPTGLLLAQLIASGGATSVTVAAPRQFKLDAALRLGVDGVVLIDRADPEANVEALRAASPDGEGYDIVVEATGSPEVGNTCVSLARNGGTVLIYGVAKEADLVQFHPFDVFRREITIKGSFAEVTSFAAAIAALRNGRVKTDGIITHRFHLDDYADALETVDSRRAHKVDIHTSDGVRPELTVMTPPTLLGVDLGTSSVKVVVTDQDGHLLAQVSRAYEVVSANVGWAESEPRTWWRETVLAVR